jgi:hypothetical protein
MTQDEALKIRARAASYARLFLANKYSEEYAELYNAYLVNRGLTTRKGKPMTDERTTVKE